MDQRSRKGERAHDHVQVPRRRVRPGATVRPYGSSVEQDSVFAIFNTLGTNNNLAVRDYLNQSKVPQLFVASGTPAFGSDPRSTRNDGLYPHLYEPKAPSTAATSREEAPTSRSPPRPGRRLRRDLLARPEARALGTKAEANRLGSSATTRGSRASPRRSAQLKASKANGFLIFAFGKFAVQAARGSSAGLEAEAGRRQRRREAGESMTLGDLAGGKAINKGAISIVDFRTQLIPSGRRIRARARAEDPQEVSPWGQSEGRLLRRRDGFGHLARRRAQARRQESDPSVGDEGGPLDEPVEHPLVIPGIVVKTSPTDGFPIEQVALERWTNGHWSMFGPLLTAKSSSAASATDTSSHDAKGGLSMRTLRSGTLRSDFVRRGRICLRSAHRRRDGLCACDCRADKRSGAVDLRRRVTGDGCREIAGSGRARRTSPTSTSGFVQGGTIDDSSSKSCQEPPRGDNTDLHGDERRPRQPHPFRQGDEQRRFDDGDLAGDVGRAAGRQAGRCTPPSSPEARSSGRLSRRRPATGWARSRSPTRTSGSAATRKGTPVTPSAARRRRHTRS